MEWLLATLTSLGECGKTKVTKEKEPKRCPNSRIRSIEEHSITQRLLWQMVLAYPDYSKVFESYTRMLPETAWSSNITQDNCWTRSVKTLTRNLLRTAVQYYGALLVHTVTYRQGQSISWQVQANCILYLDLSIMQCKYSVAKLNYWAIVETY